MTDQHCPALSWMEEISDPEELAQAQARHERFARNSAWLQRHATEIYTQYRGKCVCVAGEELFGADTPEEVLAQARTPIAKALKAVVTEETQKLPPRTHHLIALAQRAHVVLPRSSRTSSG